VNPAALQHIADPSYLDGMETWPLADLRARRGDCQYWEDAISFARRTVQARLDIVRHELVRRRAGHPRSSLSELIGLLPDTLVDSPSPSSGLSRSNRTTTVDAPTELAELVDRHPLDVIELRSDGDLDLIEIDLVGSERALSEARRTVFDRLDQLSAELTRRYRSGDASVDALLA
jgi:hypothetical protein